MACVDFWVSSHIATMDVLLSMNLRVVNELASCFTCLLSTVENVLLYSVVVENKMHCASGHADYVTADKFDSCR